jgi:hypothetical protein
MPKTPTKIAGCAWLLFTLLDRRIGKPRDHSGEPDSKKPNLSGPVTRIERNSRRC